MDGIRLTSDISGLLQDLEGPEVDYVWTRSRGTTDKEAYEAAGVAKSTFYTWPEERRAKLNEVADALRRNRVAQAQYELTQGVADAARELVRLAKDRNKTVRIRAVEGVLDRVCGKPIQRQEVSGPEGEQIGVKIDLSSLADADLGALARIADSIAGDSDGAGQA